MRYSNPEENISVVLNADSGFVFLSPMLMHFIPSWEGFVVFYEHNETDLTLIGTLDVLNEALQSLKYLGHDHFYGEDTIRISARNSNGKNDVEIGVLVDPINDPPFIHAPKSILLKSHGGESLLYDKEVDKFEFTVGDPDLQNFPGLDSHFVVAFSVEVDLGFLTTKLRSELIESTELKLQKSHQWQPLEQYVTISKHFTVKARGIRFQGTLEDCDNVMQNLSYHDEEKEAVLTLKVNDMGHFGCLHPHCSERVSTSLCSETSVKLVYTKPLNSFATTALGAASIIEFAIVVALGAVLLFFTCRCAFLLGSDGWGGANNPALGRTPPKLLENGLRNP